MTTLKVALLGVGRIGRIHAENIALNSRSQLECIFDINKKSLKDVSKIYGGNIVESAEEAINNKNIDVVYICSDTSTHTKYILSAAKAGKAVFCEKPLDLDINKVNKCKKELDKYNVQIHIGFNRRFDPSHLSAIDRKNNGEIGKLEQIILTSRDPNPPSAAYLKVSGGMFRDMTIHDFDLMRYILEDDPIEKVFATGSILFDEDTREINDMDTAMIIMKSKSGVLCHINNSRRAVYGYDQRIELFGSKGMVISDNISPTSLKKYSDEVTKANEPLYHFFIERYKDAYRIQLEVFTDCIINNKPTAVNFDDGRNALILANGAVKSFETGKFEAINFS